LFKLLCLIIYPPKYHAQKTYPGFETRDSGVEKSFLKENTFLHSNQVISAHAKKSGLFNFFYGNQKKGKINFKVVADYFL
jgi:hypothetical protein